MLIQNYSDGDTIVLKGASAQYRKPLQSALDASVTSLTRRRQVQTLQLLFNMKILSTRNTQITDVADAIMVPTTAEIPELLILPEDRSLEARICTLAHPRTSTPSRYYFDPNKGIYQFTRVAEPKSTYRSWLVSGRAVAQPKGATKQEKAPASEGTAEQVGDLEASPSTKLEDKDEKPISDGYIIKNAELLVATPIDYLFLLLPSFTNPSSAKSPSKGLFVSVDDLLEKLSENSSHFNQLANHEPTRLAMEMRMQAVCDTVNAGDEEMYRLNDDRLLNELVHKAGKMVAIGLPASMEERFVRKALESPVMVINHEESFISDSNLSQTNTLLLESTSSDAQDSQASTATSVSTASISTEVTVPNETKFPTDEGEIYHLLRMRTALSYMMSAYIPPTIAATLNTLLASEKSPVNFEKLDERLASIAKMRAEALAARSLGDFSRKRSIFEEDEAAETRAEKKRRKEEEEKKKKAGESRSIRDLKKVDTKGMKKMSDFFGNGAVAKKK